MITIQDYIKEMEEEGLNATQIALRISVSQPMVSIYKKENGNVNLNTALYIYKEYGVCLHPYAIESLDYELAKRSKLNKGENNEQDTNI